MPPDPPRLRGLTAPCSYSRLLFSSQLPTSNIIETLGTLFNHHTVNTMCNLTGKLIPFFSGLRTSNHTLSHNTNLHVFIGILYIAHVHVWEYPLPPWVGSDTYTASNDDRQIHLCSPTLKGLRLKFSSDP